MGTLGLIITLYSKEAKLIEALLTTLIVALASKGVLDAWFDGTVFSTARAHAEAWRESNSAYTSLAGELLSCRFCLGYHISFWITVLCCFNNLSPILLLPVWLAGRAIEHEVEIEIRRRNERRDNE